MSEEKRISGAQFLEELEESLQSSQEPELNKDGLRLSSQAAAFLLGEPGKEPSAGLLDREQARKLAGQILRKSGPFYLDWNYGSPRTAIPEKHFEGMLLLTLDSLSLPEGVDRDLKREELFARVRERGPTYAEYLLMNTTPVPGPAEYREKDRPDPENRVTEKTGKLFTALAHCMNRNAGLPTPRGKDFAREAQVYAGMPLCRLTLRNRRVSEMLERREFGNVAEALAKTRAAFQFADKDDLISAQRDMKTVLSRMSDHKPEKDPERTWAGLRNAARKFTTVRHQINGADAAVSAKLFCAAESFIQAQPGNDRGPCADLALSAVAAGVPDAPRNPSVKALVDDLNARRGPGEAITVPDRGAPSAGALPPRPMPAQRPEADIEAVSAAQVSA